VAGHFLSFLTSAFLLSTIRMSRYHVPTALRGIRRFEMPFGHLKSVGCASAPFVCFHRARRRHAERKYDGQFRIGFDALHSLMDPSEVPEESKIGYLSEGK